MNSPNRLIQLNEYNRAMSRVSFWHFCKTNAPRFYRTSRPHLILLCITLESFYKGCEVTYDINREYNRGIELESPFKECLAWEDIELQNINGEWQKGTRWKADIKTQGGERCKNLAINVPPRHGKSRTLFLFAAWIFGNDPKYMIGTYSYNSKMAEEFSMYTRDTIEEEKLNPFQIIYNDIFPRVKLKHGNKSVKKWALEEAFFNYMGAGWETGFTGRGFNLIMGDDPIKSSLEAFNQKHLEKMAETYKNSILSRLEGGDDNFDEEDDIFKGYEQKDGLEILNLTRWSKMDLVGVNLDGPNGHLWQVCKMKAWAENQGMLCKGMLSKERYDYLESELDPAIFLANYHQEPPDLLGILYKTILTYEKKPEEFESIPAYIDTADQGDDNLCCFVAGKLDDDLYILDAYYTKDGMEITEDATAEFLHENSRHGDIDCDIESNNGGEAFGRHVEDKLDEIDKFNRVDIKTFHQSENKIARILSHSAFIQKHVFFPHNWKAKWPRLYKDLTQYMKEGDNTHDDAPDCLTGLVEKAFTTSTFDLYLKGR